MITDLPDQMFPKVFTVSVSALEEASFPFLSRYREELFKEQKLILSVHRRYNEIGSTHAVKKYRIRKLYRERKMLIPASFLL